MVLNSIDGANFFYNDADGALATTAWRAAGLASAHARARSAAWAASSP